MPEDFEYAFDNLSEVVEGLLSFASVAIDLVGRWAIVPTWIFFGRSPSAPGGLRRYSPSHDNDNLTLALLAAADEAECVTEIWRGGRKRAAMAGLLQILQFLTSALRGMLGFRSSGA